MADKTIPDLTTASLNTAYYFPFAVDAATEANKSTIGSLADFYKMQYIDRQIGTTTVDPIGITYGGWGIHGNLLITGKFHASGTGYFDSIIAGSVESITIGNNTSHVVSGPSSVIQNASYCSIFGGYGSLIKHSASSSSIIAGSNNVLEAGSIESVCLGGENNNVGGSRSCVLGSSNSTSSGFSCFSAGSSNSEAFGVYNSIIGSRETSILGPSENCFCVASYNSYISGMVLSSSIIGGTNNKITGNSYNSTIVGGNNCSVFSKRNLSTSNVGSIIGSASCIVDVGIFSSILGSSSSFISGNVSSIIGSISSTISGDTSFVFGSSNSIVKTLGLSYGGIIGGTHNVVSGSGIIVLGGNNNTVFARNSYVSAINANVPSNLKGVHILGDSLTTLKSPKRSDSIAFFFTGGATVSGGSLEVEKTGAFYGGVVMGTGKTVITALTGISTIPTFGIAPDSYSGYAISAPGVNTGDFVTITLQTYSGAAFGLPDGNLICFTPQPYFDQIRFYLYNPPGPSSISPPPNVRWLSYKTTLLDQI